MISRIPLWECASPIRETGRPRESPRLCVLREWGPRLTHTTSAGQGPKGESSLMTQGSRWENALVYSTDPLPPVTDSHFAAFGY